MGLFSRKSPEEKRLKKFSKTEENVKKSISVYKKISSFAPPIFSLYDLSATREEYVKTGEYFQEWLLNKVPEALSNSRMFTHSKFWEGFRDNISKGLISLLIVDEYGECLKCCDALMDMKEDLFNKKIARGSGSFLSVAELAVASAGVGGNSKQEALIKQVEFYKLICLTELEKEPSARLMLKEFPDNYALKIKKDDDYFNQHFKYKDNLSIEYMKEKLQK